MSQDDLILASASPRRRELLCLAGIPHRVVPGQVAERPRQGEVPEQFTRRAAAEKAEQVAARCPAGSWVLAADTSVVVGDQLLGKPRDRADGRRMLRLLSDSTHRVLTAVTLTRASPTKGESLLEETRVTFRPLDQYLIDGYLDTGEPMDKAGAYGIQGMGAMLVRSISGSYTNVVGLPLCETVGMLERAGLWRPFRGGGR